ncbi:Glutamate--tRNA ligase [Yarrowia sp. C11]|nr:Glutamate--tRNA ligase [Yarrowia sp. C11]KAG5370688.1 Glutamate--tRNA ligase [Yarrowia sp. E02]
MALWLRAGSRMALSRVQRPFSVNTVRNSSFSLRKKDTSQPTSSSQSPERTRFAPSPTGLLHLGSLRTALFNYLQARVTKGQFLLRVEDTDQTRLVPGAEEHLYKTLGLLGIKADESPEVGGPYGPYKQSERTEIYRKYVDQLLESGHAYKCYCSKERLDELRDSARALVPPSMASYDRKCAHGVASETNSGPYVVRFKAPDQYPSYTDELHGQVNIQVQRNANDVRFDDIVLLKSDGLPTYHLANVVDDHLMKISTVIRGEEWMPSTPKHIALYEAFGWTAPRFIHIPLLTSVDNKKLSKRSGDTDVMSLIESGYLPEAILNFVLHFGWSYQHIQKSDRMSLARMEQIFDLKTLTKGNAKVDFSKLIYYNKTYMYGRIKAPGDMEWVKPYYEAMKKETDTSKTLEECLTAMEIMKGAFGNVEEFVATSRFLFERPMRPMLTLEEEQMIRTIAEAQNVKMGVALLDTKYEKKQIYQVLRKVIADGTPGASMDKIRWFLGPEEVQARLEGF